MARVLELVDRDELSELSRRTDVHALAMLAAHLGALGASGAWVWVTRTSPWVVPALVVYGAVMAHLFALLHECTHRTPFRSSWVNAAVAHGCGVVIGLPAGYFRLEHLAHHQSTQDPERDPELIPLPRSLRAYLAFVVGIPYWSWAARTTVAHVFGRTPAFEHRFVTPRNQRPVVTEARIYVAVWAVVIGAAAVAGHLSGVVWLWLLPRLVGEPWMRVARLSEHAGRPLTRDVTEGTRSLARVPQPLRLLAWNMPFHAEHHAAPGVPFHALPALHERLAPALRGDQGGYLAAQADIVRRVRTGVGPGL